jgi:hypothetical protein
MTQVYCGACGASLNQTARFCRACGSAQAAAPRFEAAAKPLSAADTVVALLAIFGGAAICFVALYAVFYLPLHDEFPVNYGESPRIGDLLALGSGLVAIAIGALLLAGRPGNARARGIWLVVAGAPTLIVALLWAFPLTFHLSLFPVPFYFAYLYFTDLGVVHIGDGYVPLPLVAGCAMVIAAGLAILARPPIRTAPPAPPR